MKVRFKQGITAWELEYLYEGWENSLFDQNGHFITFYLTRG